MDSDALVAVKESGSIHDGNAVPLLSGDTNVGHIPMKISRLCTSFISKGGRIEALVCGSRQYAADLPQAGLDVPASTCFQERRNLRDDCTTKSVTEIVPYSQM